jgi:hypothetical protein
VTVLETHDGSGWGWNTIALRRASGGLVLYSPSWLGPGTFERVDALGTVEVLLAPNHYHHLALEAYRSRYPTAQVLAPRRALARLAAKGHVGLRALEDEPDALPPGARWLPCLGLRSGEGWLSLASPRGPGLLVCDTFTNRTRPARGLRGFALERLVGVGNGLSVPGTLRWLHARDLSLFRWWARRILESSRLTTLIVTHGDPVSAPDLTDRLLALLAEDSLPHPSRPRRSR